MVFKRMLGTFGVGGPSVDTVLAVPSCRPGERLAGEVRIKAADYDVEIQRISLSLVTRVEVEGADHEQAGGMEFHRVDVSGPFTLPREADRVIAFELDVPWETPLTEVYGQHLHGMVMGVRTELAVAKAVDKGDLDQVAVGPAPSQQRVLDAFAELGFAFKSADVEYGRIAGVHQELPFYQEIEFYPPPEHQGRVNEVELTFVASPHGLAVVLEADKRGGLFTSGGDAFGRFQVSHAEALQLDWAAEISGWLHAVADRHGAAFHPGGHGSYEDHHGHGGRGGPGWGTVAAAGAAGVAAGVVGGMVAGEIAEEVFEEVFEDDEGDED
ncbi:sporulation protein [Actinomadura sp. GC306]|uniref:sporulation protein n=1 Tax=Actinomadura sp. GC306 TaxID=2530367 RepID=UPI00104FEA74|nr:sporulation protein [Actinomadura sp. GC306]TDC67473.1 sporulation protein [Actinomadura sp. GC306]